MRFTITKTWGNTVFHILCESAIEIAMSITITPHTTDVIDASGR